MERKKPCLRQLMHALGPEEKTHLNNYHVREEATVLVSIRGIA